MTEIRKRRLGRTGLMVTELGLGAMDTPQSEEGEATLREALELGINFVDTAREYHGSEYLIGQVLRAGDLNVPYLSTKTFSRTRDGCQYEVDRSLRFLGVAAIDLYQLHDVSTPEAWDQAMGEGGALEGLQIAQLRGLIRHIGISSHSLDIVDRAITSGAFDVVMLEYSVFFPDTERLITLAREHDVGVMVMRPLGGSGRMSSIRTQMASGYEGPFTPDMLLRYVLSNPDISAAMVGSRYPSRIRQNVAVATSYEPLDDDEKRVCEREAERRPG